MSDSASHAAVPASEQPTPAQLAEFFRQVDSGRVTKQSLQAFLRGATITLTDASSTAGKPVAIPGLSDAETIYYTELWEKYFPGFGRMMAEHLGLLQLPKHIHLAVADENRLEELGRAVFWRQVTPRFVRLEQHKARPSIGGKEQSRAYALEQQMLTMFTKQSRPQFVGRASQDCFEAPDTAYQRELSYMHTKMVHEQLKAVFDDANNTVERNSYGSLASCIADNLEATIKSVMHQVVLKNGAPDFLPLLRAWEQGYWLFNIDERANAFFLAQA